jgi:hypothetical protein
MAVLQVQWLTLDETDQYGQCSNPGHLGVNAILMSRPPNTFLVTHLGRGGGNTVVACIGIFVWFFIIHLIVLQHTVITIITVTQQRELSQLGVTVSRNVTMTHEGTHVQGKSGRSLIYVAGGYS